MQVPKKQHRRRRLPRGGSDNGPEFVAKELCKWIDQATVETLFIAPGTPILSLRVVLRTGEGPFSFEVSSSSGFCMEAIHLSTLRLRHRVLEIQ